MSSMIRINRTMSVCDDGIASLAEYRDQKYKTIITYDDEERIAWIWCLLFVMIIPEIFTLWRSGRICVFKSFKKSYASTFFLVREQIYYKNNKLIITKNS